MTSFIEHPYVQIFGLLFGGFGLSLLVWSLRGAKKVASGESVLERYDDYLLSAAQFHEINEAYEFMKFHVGALNISPLNTWKARHNLNPNTLFLLRVRSSKPGPSEHELKGVFSFIPVTQAAVDLLNLNKLSAGGFEKQHIASSVDEADGFYISILIGEGAIAKGVLISHLRLKVLEAVAADKPTFARPATSLGLRTAKDFSFAPVQDGMNQLHEIHRYH
ncbi:MAG: hypothetical protein AAGD04_00175 [Pseudomonadota bacterium]